MKFWPAFYIVGIIILIGYFIVAIVGVGYLFGFGPEDYTEEEKHDSGVSLLLICTPMLLLPGLILFYFGWRGYRLNEQVKDTAGMLRAYGKINLTELGIKMGKSQDEMEELIFECLEENLVQGYLDRPKREFITYEYLARAPEARPRFGWKCPECSEYNESEKLPGDVVKCSFCKRRLPIGSRHVKEISRYKKFNRGR